MKTLKEIEQNLEIFEKIFGFKIQNSEQGSGLWLQTKLGVISASNAHKAVSKKDSDKRWTYLYELVAQIASGVTEEINSKYLDYGAEHESAARALYELHTKKTITPVAFIFKDESFRCGASPDGIIEGQHGLELKVPYTPVNYAKFLCAGNIDTDYQWQCQFSMWVTDSESWHFAMFSPVFKVKPIKIVTVEKDAEKQKVLSDLIPQFISDMDMELKKIGLEFGQQWSRLGEK